MIPIRVHPGVGSRRCLCLSEHGAPVSQEHDDIAQLECDRNGRLGGHLIREVPLFLGQGGQRRCRDSLLGHLARDQLADAADRINSAWMHMARSVIGSITGASMVLVMVSAAALRHSRMVCRPRASRGGGTQQGAPTSTVIRRPLMV